jgi:hypothetical protein
MSKFYADGRPAESGGRQVKYDAGGRPHEVGGGSDPVAETSRRDVLRQLAEVRHEVIFLRATIKTVLEAIEAMEPGERTSTETLIHELLTTAYAITGRI